MSFYIDNIVAYFQMEVIETEWNKMMQLIAKNEDFDEIQEIHNNFLETVYSQFFLRSQKIEECLQALCEECGRLCKYVEDRECKKEPVNSLADISEKFHSIVKMLFVMLSGVKKNQTSSFLPELLMKLDFNGYLSMTNGGNLSP